MKWQSQAAQELSQYVQRIFESFKDARAPFEEVWRECWYNFLGQYQPDKVWKRKTEGKGYRSKIFIKLTALKCHTAHSKISDVLFSGRSGIPFDIEILSDSISDPALSEQILSLKDMLIKKLKEHFKKINLKKTLDIAILEMCIFGTAVLKAPILQRKRKAVLKEKAIAGIPLKYFSDDLNAVSISYEEELIPTVCRVPLWEYYVDTNAYTPAESIGEIHFQRMLPSAFRQLVSNENYDIEACIEALKRLNTRSDDDKKFIQLGEKYTGEESPKDEKISVLEYWGLVPVRMLREYGEEIDPGIDDNDSIEALVVLAADGIVIKAQVNPLGRRPFFVCPFKERPGQIYGVGVAEAMRDSQKMINSVARLIIDNKALSGNGMVAVNIDRINTKRTKDLEVYPGKTWYIKGNFTPREAIDAVVFPDVTLGLQQLMEMFERFADEETGIPKYTIGMQDSFLNKTATGMSMLMTQANINLKTVLENIDDYWIEPIVEVFADWFMDFGGLPRFPFTVKATGTDSMIAKEIKMENYMRFLQITSSPPDAMLLDRVKLMKEIAKILEIGEIMRSDEEIQAILSTASQMAQQPTDLRQRVNIEKLYPYLTRKEQMQILKQIGIEPEEELMQNNLAQDIFASQIRGEQ